MKIIKLSIAMGVVGLLAVGSLAFAETTISGSMTSSGDSGHSTSGSMIMHPPGTNMPFPVPPQPTINQPTLTIGPGGKFLARGMTVTSVSGNSFQGQIWGITYTVNPSSGTFQFYARTGNATSTTSGVAQVAVGDEVGVEGLITTASPMVVTGNVIRDYNMTTMMSRPAMPRQNNEKNDGESGMHTPTTMPLKGVIMNGTASATPPSSANVNEINQRVNNLFKQIQDIQNKMKSIQGQGTSTTVPPAPALTPATGTSQ